MTDRTAKTKKRLMEFHGAGKFDTQRVPKATIELVKQSVQSKTETVLFPTGREESL